MTSDPCLVCTVNENHVSNCETRSIIHSWNPLIHHASYPSIHLYCHFQPTLAILSRQQWSMWIKLTCRFNCRQLLCASYHPHSVRYTIIFRIILMSKKILWHHNRLVALFLTNINYMAPTTNSNSNTVPSTQRLVLMAQSWCGGL